MSSVVAMYWAGMAALVFCWLSGGSVPWPVPVAWTLGFVLCRLRE